MDAETASLMRGEQAGKVQRDHEASTSRLRNSPKHRPSMAASSAELASGVSVPHGCWSHEKFLDGA